MKLFKVNILVKSPLVHYFLFFFEITEYEVLEKRYLTLSNIKLHWINIKHPSKTMFKLD